MGQKAIKIKRDKDGFMVGDPSDLSIYLPFMIHDDETDTWEFVEDGDNLVDWGSDIDTKPQYDKIMRVLDANKVVEWLGNHVVEWQGQGFIRTFTPTSPAGCSYIVEQFKQDFGL